MFDNCEAMVDGLTEVVGRDAAALGEDGLLDRLSTISALESVLAAAKAQTMVEFHHALAGTSADLGHDGPRPGDRPAGPAERRWSREVLRSVSDEIGLALGAHRRTAARWMNRAAVLVERFPATHELLRSGGLPVAAAQHIAHELAVVVDDDLRGAVEQVVLAWGRRYGWVRIKQIAQREATKVVAEYDSLLHAQRHAERTTYMVCHDGGTADLVVSTSALDIAAILTALTQRAIQLRRHGDTRSLDELRTDIAVARLLGADDLADSVADEKPANAGPSAHNDASTAGAPADSQSGEARTTAGTDADPGARAGVEVVIHCSYAEAAALATGVVCTGGELDGYGALPQDALAMAFRRAKFRYRLTDREPVADPLRHDPSPALATHVRDRDRRCRFPGCTSPAMRCDLDHRRPFPRGTTDAHNLESLCRHHHRLKHLGDWRVFTTDDLTLIWISPTGRAYLDPPARSDAA